MSAHTEGLVTSRFAILIDLIAPHPQVRLGESPDARPRGGRHDAARLQLSVPRPARARHQLVLAVLQPPLDRRAAQLRHELLLHLLQPGAYFLVICRGV